MKPGMVFDAPWGLSVKLVTIFSIGILGGVIAIGLLNDPGYGIIWIASMVILPLAVLIGAAFFMIRGYELTREKLFVRRLGWKTEVDLNELQAVEINPDAMKKSIRTFGNGGMFGFSGKFRNKQLGSYRAFATNPELAVILKFADKVIVVTPDNPDKFAVQIKAENML